MKTRDLILILLCSLCLMFSGCSSGHGLLRPSPYFGGMKYSNPKNLGQHGYKGGGSNGMVYTCNAGFIDLGHVRESADRVKYVYDLVYPCMLKKTSLIGFNILEPATFYVHIKYPDDWDKRDNQEKQEIARQRAISLAEYVAHKSLIWHETITWYGWSCTRLFPEKPSSFSWEDVYSDSLGCNLGAQALAMGGSYNKNMTKLLEKELEKLDVQPMFKARQAVQKIKGSWFSGGPYPFINMKKRNFDVLDGSTDPWIVKGICDNCRPIAHPVLDLNSISKDGFNFKIELQPKSLQGKKAARLATMFSKRIIPEEHFPVIIRKIRAQAIRQKGSSVDKPGL